MARERLPGSPEYQFWAIRLMAGTIVFLASSAQGAITLRGFLEVAEADYPDWLYIYVPIGEFLNYRWWLIVVIISVAASIGYVLNGIPQYDWTPPRLKRAFAWANPTEEQVIIGMAVCFVLSTLVMLVTIAALIQMMLIRLAEDDGAEAVQRSLPLGLIFLAGIAYVLAKVLFPLFKNIVRRDGN